MSFLTSYFYNIYNIMLFGPTFGDHAKLVKLYFAGIISNLEFHITSLTLVLILPLPYFHVAACSPA